jgi:predicted amidophosphoribosyltransferase
MRSSAWFSLPGAASARDCGRARAAFPVAKSVYHRLNDCPASSARSAGGLCLDWRGKEGSRCSVLQAKTKPMLLIEPAALQFMEDAVVQAIRLLKFEQIEPLGAWFSARLAEMVDADTALPSADFVVPVPLHRQREKERGTTRRQYSPSLWRKGSDCHTKRCC